MGLNLELPPRYRSQLRRATRRQPSGPRHTDLFREPHLVRPHRLFPRGHHAAIENDFEPVEGHEARCAGMYFNGTATGTENDLVAGRVTVGLEKEQWPRRHKGFSAANRFGPARE